MKKVYILGGGTISHVRNHLALCAPAFGSTARQILDLCQKKFTDTQNYLFLTKMADFTSPMITNEDVEELVKNINEDLNVKVVFFNVAMCDWNGEIAVNLDEENPELIKSGKYAKRLKTSEGHKVMMLKPAEKIIKRIRENRKDIFVVGFKTTCGATEQEQYIAGLNLLKTNSINLVLANDTRTRLNMIITPEEAKYQVIKNREWALAELVDMTWYRSQLTFTRSTVVDGKPVAWDSSEVPGVLRAVVNYCITNGAYKVFNGATVGHFAAKIGTNEFLTSIRKSNFNDIGKNGLVRIKTDGPDTVIAYGAKPSVGGQSQRIVFSEHPEYDCIVHFHCPLKENHLDDIPVISQREYECGSHQCGQNTSNGLKKFGNLSCVMLDNHGPNIVFHSSISIGEVTSFIYNNFNLDAKTGGPVN